VKQKQAKIISRHPLVSLVFTFKLVVFVFLLAVLEFTGALPLEPYPQPFTD
jgi:hypothetical protein